MPQPTAALSQSTLSDSRAEVMTMHHLGLMATRQKIHYAHHFSEKAAEQSSFLNKTRLTNLVAAGISRHLVGEDEVAKSLISGALKL